MWSCGNNNMEAEYTVYCCVPSINCRKLMSNGIFYIFIDIVAFIVCSTSCQGVIQVEKHASIHGLCLVMKLV